LAVARLYAGGGLGAMAEEEGNIVLRLLREIRSQQVDDGRRLQRVERHLDELREATVTAMGVAGLASVSTEKHGQEMDELRDQLEALRRRVAALENRA
jgi:polyhydroxyalkanoate synthesis regulator phasin